MKKIIGHKFEEIISIDNLLLAWQEFIVGKSKRKDVTVFRVRLMDNILSLHRDLLYHKYRHGKYESFRICDPKPRFIHKANVRDRLLHHAVCRVLNPFFDRKFIYDLYSNRIGKGTHRAVNKLSYFLQSASRNYTRNCWVLKGDIRKCFASIDQGILINILQENISDKDLLWLLTEIMKSFDGELSGKGIPLGNLTSQLFVNIYLGEFDIFMKHRLKAVKYIRYADDFVVVSSNKKYLSELIELIRKFLDDKLALQLHPRKVEIRKFSQGIDFLGYVVMPHYRVLRTKTKYRMLKKIREKYELQLAGGLDKESFGQSLESYYGILGHCRAQKICKKIDGIINSSI